MSKKIIYPKHNGGVVVVTPVTGCGFTIEEIAAKDIPTGTPYKIVDASEIPSDRTFRDAWEFQL